MLIKATKARTKIARLLPSELLRTGSDTLPLLERVSCIPCDVAVMTLLHSAPLLQLPPLRLPLAPQLINVHDVPPWHVHLHCIPIHAHPTTTA